MYQLVYLGNIVGLSTKDIDEAMRLCNLNREAGIQCNIHKYEAHTFTAIADYTTPDGEVRHKGDKVVSVTTRLIY